MDNQNQQGQKPILTDAERLELQRKGGLKASEGSKDATGEPVNDRDKFNGPKNNDPNVPQSPVGG